MKHTSFRYALLLICFLQLGTPLRAQWIDNAWPIFTIEHNDLTNETVRVNALGPFYSQNNKGPVTTNAFRPFYAKFHDTKNNIKDYYYLYPLVRRQVGPKKSSWTIFNLIHFQNDDHHNPETKQKRFRLFPFYSFVGEPEQEDTNNHSMFPVAGNIEHFFGVDEVSWLLFPLWASSLKGEDHKYYFLWPFFRIQKGPTASGTAFWPIYGCMQKENNYKNSFVLWPFYYNNQTHLYRDTPTIKHGLLPFYAKHTWNNGESFTWAWPFFGYTSKWDPQYHEKRFLWPLLVQARGQKRYINRWAPIFTHSSYNSTHKWWFLWPIHKIKQWEEGELELSQKQFGLVLGWSQTQKRKGDEHSAIASKHHVWPFLSAWDNGAGQKQFQFFSPLEPFFPHNRVVRELYSPFFALYRYHQQAPGWSHCSFLFNFITLQKSPTRTQFTLGPILTVDKGGDQPGFQLLKGLFASNKKEGKRIFKLFWITL